jgi:hypothetical protein
MQKVDSIQAARVSLKDGLTILDLKPGNTTTLKDLRRIIKNNGFVSKEAAVAARGSTTADQKTFVVDGSNEQLPLTSPPQRRGDDWTFTVLAPNRP